MRDDPTEPTADGVTETLVGDDEDAPPRRASPSGDPAQIGRFVVLKRLGEGGMGVVYAAYDPELDRKLAIKLIRGGARNDDVHTARLLREAQALARLSHPNVISIYDVGTFEGQVYVAMEFVEGVTLARWLDDRRDDDWRTRLGAVLQAGRGLAAAHAVGLIHRDFKPENVLVGDDGRVRVLDFGLARVLDVDEDHDIPSPAATGALGHGLDVRLTRAGSILGTPAYMAPEQFEGEATDARTDQFSFCVVAFEAVFQTRPFPGENVLEIATSVLEQAPVVPSGAGSGTVPGHLRREIVRGLSRQPRDRHPDLATLLNELERASRGRPMWQRAAIGLLPAAALVGWALASSGEPPCAHAAASVQKQWSTERALAVSASFEATQLDYATSVADAVLAGMDDYARRLATTREEVCAATHVRNEQSSALMDLRMACLDERGEELGALAQVLADADPELVAEAQAAVGRLRDIDYCTRATTTGTGEPPAPHQAEEVARLRAELAEVRALLAAGRYTEAVAPARGLVERADALGYLPLAAEVHAVFGGLARDVHGEDASAHLTNAIALARRAHNSEASASALTDLVGHLSGAPEHYDSLVQWFPLARAEVELVGNERLLASLLLSRAIASRDQARHAEAEADLEQALEIRTRIYGPDHEQVAEVLSQIGRQAWEVDDLDRAQELFERATEITRARLGDRHPSVAKTLNPQAGLHWIRRDLEGARRLYEEILAISQAAYGEDHESVAQAYANIGATMATGGDLKEGRDYLEKGLEISLRLEPDSALITTDLENLAEIERQLGDFESARQRLVRSLALRERVLGPDHPDVARPLLHLGALALDEGKPDEARPLHERALALRSKTEAHRILLGRARFGLARALWSTPRDRARAEELASLARADFEQLGPTGAADLEKLTTWLDERGRPLRPPPTR